MTPMSKRKDPPVAEDGLCAVCGGERPIVAVKHDDPFCSSRCCRDYHRVDFIGEPEAEKKVSGGS